MKVVAEKQIEVMKNNISLKLSEVAVTRSSCSTVETIVVTPKHSRRAEMIQLTTATAGAGGFFQTDFSH